MTSRTTKYILEKLKVKFATGQ